MVDAPEKIWANYSPDFGIVSTYDVEMPSNLLTWHTEYTRSDIAAELAAENERLRKALDALGAFAFWFQKYPEFKPNPDMQAEMLADLDRARPFIPARRALTGGE